MTPLKKEEIIAETRRKKHRKRSVAELHEHFEHFCNAVSAVRYLFSVESLVVYAP